MAFYDHFKAMGSGPHPNVPYGLPAPQVHSLDNASSCPLWDMPIFWLTLLIVAIGLLLRALPKARKG